MFRDPTVAEVAAWWRHAADARIAGAVRSIYDRMAEHVRGARPVCTASGRCCHFDRAGHDLFVTGLEAALAMRWLPEGVGLDANGLDAAVRAGTCPFLIGTSCGARDARPAGCRAFFCDPTRVEWSRGEAEVAVREIRAVHDAQGVPYLYGEWRRILRAFVRDGLAPAAANAVTPTRTARAMPDQARAFVPIGLPGRRSQDPPTSDAPASA